MIVYISTITSTQKMKAAFSLVALMHAEDNWNWFTASRVKMDITDAALDCSLHK
jgi:hypothetical protein